MPKGIYKRKRKNEVVVAQHFPLEAIPERPTPVVKATKAGIELGLLGLCHRMLDQQERLMTMLQTPKQPRKYKKRQKA